MRIAIFCTAIASMALAGCAIHPLPEDVTGINTVNLTNHIRCEARIAINTAISKYLSKVKNDPAAVSLSANLMSGEFYDPKRDYGLLPDVKAAIDKYMPAAITYDFTFDMTETNNIVVTSSFLGPITNGVMTYAFGASNNLTRENNRNFFITDNFENLLISKQMSKYCSGYAGTINFEYPISGEIGLEKPLETFVNLNEFEDLSAKSSGSSPAPTMADTLKFTTALSASFSPSVAITGKSGLSAAGGTPAISRTDVHQVIVALTLPLPPKPAKPSAAPLKTSEATEKASAADRGKAAVEQQRMNQFYNNSIILVK